MQEVSDPFIPVMGHGLLSLTKLIATRDPESLSHSHTLLSVFTECLTHPDSYVYLAAINGLVSLSKIPDACDYVISTLCQGYAQLNCTSAPKKDSLVDLETGQLRTHLPINENKSPSKIDPSGGSRNEKLSVEVRMKLGEALVKVAWSCGELLPHYLDQITSAIFSNVNDPEPLIRASSLSNLADFCAGVKLSFSRIKNEVCMFLVQACMYNVHCSFGILWCTCVILGVLHVLLIIIINNYILETRIHVYVIIK